jgi:adenylate cyclase
VRSRDTDELDANAGEGRVARAAGALRRLNAQPELVSAARRARRRLPGDSAYGDPLSTAGTAAPDLLGRQLAALSGERPSVMRELGFGALQLWQGLAEAQGRGYGEREVTIMFTDIVGFSSFALEAGDEAAVELLRQVDGAVAAAVSAHGGEVVKRLGDGLMAVFEHPQEAVDAGQEACRAVAHIEVEAHRPALRVGTHLGRPRRLGGDYFGVDVNVASRIAAAADGGEVLVSERLVPQLDAGRVALRERRSFAAKGAPAGLRVYAAEPASALS